MAILTKRVLVVKIQRMLEGMLPASTETIYTERFILSHVNDQIAFMAKRSALENSNLDSVTFSADEFTTTYKSVPITKNAAGQYYLDLPDMPIGLPKGRGLVSIKPSNSYKNNIFKFISAREFSQVLSLPKIPNKIFSYVQDGNVLFNSCMAVIPTPVDITMVSSGGNNLDDELHIPADVEGEITMNIYKMLLNPPPMDVTNDGEEYRTNGAR